MTLEYNVARCRGERCEAKKTCSRYVHRHDVAGRTAIYDFSLWKDVDQGSDCSHYLDEQVNRQRPEHQNHGE